jgi:uncharacterized protein YndB with AHSA1/START domain
MSKANNPVIIEQTFKTSIQNVWKSITDVTQMRLWFFENIPSFVPEVGFETRFNVRSGNRGFLHLWKLTEVIPPKKIVYDWRYEGFPGNGTVSFELFEQNDGTLLRLTNEGLETFPSHIPEFTRESCIGGWEYFIKDSLKAFLEEMY